MGVAPIMTKSIHATPESRPTEARDSPPPFPSEGSRRGARTNPPEVRPKECVDKASADFHWVCNADKVDKLARQALHSLADRAAHRSEQGFCHTYCIRTYVALRIWILPRSRQGKAGVCTHRCRFCVLFLFFFGARPSRSAKILLVSTDTHPQDRVLVVINTTEIQVPRTLPHRRSLILQVTRCCRKIGISPNQAQGGKLQSSREKNKSKRLKVVSDKHILLPFSSSGFALAASRSNRASAVPSGLGHSVAEDC